MNKADNKNKLSKYHGKIPWNSEDMVKCYIDGRAHCYYCEKHNTECENECLTNKKYICSDGEKWKNKDEYFSFNSKGCHSDLLWLKFKKKELRKLKKVIEENPNLKEIKELKKLFKKNNTYYKLIKDEYVQYQVYEQYTKKYED